MTTRSGSRLAPVTAPQATSAQVAQPAPAVAEPPVRYCWRVAGIRKVLKQGSSPAALTAEAVHKAVARTHIKARAMDLRSLDHQRTSESSDDKDVELAMLATLSDEDKAFAPYASPAYPGLPYIATITHLFCLIADAGTAPCAGAFVVLKGDADKAAYHEAMAQRESRGLPRPFVGGLPEGVEPLHRRWLQQLAHRPRPVASGV